MRTTGLRSLGPALLAASCALSGMVHSGCNGCDPVSTQDTGVGLVELGQELGDVTGAEGKPELLELSGAEGKPEPVDVTGAEGKPELLELSGAEGKPELVDVPPTEGEPQLPDTSSGEDVPLADAPGADLVEAIPDLGEEVIPLPPDSDSDGWPDVGDCEPLDPKIHPGAQELCDGKDNDCDGDTDELACKTCEPCIDFSSCQSGACLETPTGEKYCSLNKNYCVYVNPADGECNTVPANTGMGCQDKTKPCYCGGGDGGADAFWFCDGVPACGGAKPFCYNGQCVPCIPGEKKCEGLSLYTCAQDGSQWNLSGECTDGQICMCGGGCADTNEFLVGEINSQLSPDVSPQVAGLAGGGFVVVYHALGDAQTDIMARLYDHEGKPLSSELIVNLPGVAGSQESPDVASFPNKDGGFVVVWDSTEGVNSDVFGRRFQNDGVPNGGAFQVNAVPDAGGPRVAAMANGTFVVVWEHLSVGVDSPDVRAQLFDKNGVKFGPEKTLNSFVANQQRTPVVAARGKVGWIAAWASLGQVDGKDIIAKRFNAELADIGGEQQINLYTQSAQGRAAAAGFLGANEGEYLVAWESYGQDSPTSSGVFLQVFTNEGNAKQPSDVPCNSKYVAGNQKDPELAVLEDDSFVVVWSSTDVPEDADGEAVMARRFGEDGKPLANEFLVNQVVAGSQRNPDVADLDCGRFVVVWLAPSAEFVQGKNSVVARIFAAP